MLREALYQEAFRFREGAVWEKLPDWNLMAVRMDSGKTAYMRVFRADGNARPVFAFYPDQEACDRYRQSLHLAADPAAQEQKLRERSLHCEIEERDSLGDGELQDAERFAGQFGYTFEGKYAYPQFVRFEPYTFPWYLESREEQARMLEAMLALSALTQMLSSAEAPDMASFAFDTGCTEIPCLEKGKTGWSLGRCILPEIAPMSWPEPAADNEVGIFRMRGLERVGIWEAEIRYLSEPVVEQDGEIPFYPCALLLMERESGYFLPVMPMRGYEEDPDLLLNRMMEQFSREGICPEEIHVQDDRTLTFFRKWCERTATKLCLDRRLAAMEESQGEVMRIMLEDNEDSRPAEPDPELEHMLDFLLGLDTDRLLTMPDDILSHLRGLLFADDLAFREQMKLRMILDRIDSVEKKETKILSFPKTRDR